MASAARPDGTAGDGDARTDAARVVAKDDPLHRLRPLGDSAHQRMSPLFERIVAGGEWRSTPTKHLLKASLLIALFTVGAQRHFCEQ